MKYFNNYFKVLLTLSITSFCITVSFPLSVNAKSINTATLNRNLKDVLNNKEEEHTVEVFNSGTQNVPLTQNDIELMARIVYAESRGEPYDGKIAVASVILNRVLDPQFPNSISEVIFQPYAFSCVVDNEINVTPTTECYNAVYDAIYGIDPTNEAVFFYNPDIATCSWMHNIKKTDTTTIGHHQFFNVIE